VHNSRLEAGRLELLRGKHSSKPASLVVNQLGLDDDDSRERGLVKDHS
jgi:hypothetical protein